MAGDLDVEDVAKAAQAPRADVIAATMAVRRALPAGVLRELKTGASLVVVLVVPSPDWCGPVDTAVRGLVGACTGVAYDSMRPHFLPRGHALFVRDGTERSMGRPDVSGKYLPTHLADGYAAIGVCADTSLLPRELLAAADHVVKVPALRWADVSKVVRAITGAPLAGKRDDALAFACSPADVGASVRPRSTPEGCVERLRRAVAKRSVPAYAGDVPRLEDLAGYGEAQEWGLMLERDLRRHRADPGAMPTTALTRSLMLAGPPGVGKTLFARSLARTLEVPLIETGYGSWSTAGAGYLNELMSAMAGSFGAARAAAKANGCAVLFIDELDSLPSRALLTGDRNAGWWTAVVNCLLQMAESSWEGRAGVILLGATNHLHRIDPALLRSGRFDRTVILGLPAAADLERMVRTHLAGELADEDVASVVALAPPSTGADAARWVRDARSVARDAGRSLALRDLVDQVAPPDVRSAAEILAYARHEAAHAVVATALCRMRIRSVSLAASGAFGGITVFHPFEGTKTRTDVEADVTGVLAGRAADEESGEVDTSSGGEASSDLAQATRYLAAYHASFAFGPSMIYLADSGAAADLVRHDLGLRALVEADLVRLYRRARDEVALRADAIGAVTEALVARRHLSGDDLRSIVAAHPPGKASSTAGAVLH